jgi:hypothetical protein
VLKKWFRDSWTIAWARFKIAAGVALTVAGVLADFLQAAGVAQYLPPTWASVTLVAIGLITEACRRRHEWADK